LHLVGWFIWIAVSTRITYFERVSVALGTQHAIHMRHFFICGLHGLEYFPSLSQKGKIFEKKITEYEMYVLIFSTTFVWNVSHSKKNWVRYNHKCIMFYTQSTRYSCHILMSFDSFPKNNKISTLIKICQVGVELFHPDRRTERRTDMKNLIVAFCHFANAPKTVYMCV
jgi:hypothetical protein